jgi:hypothetical protein
MNYRWISYEWDIETISGRKDSRRSEVLDHNHRQTLDGYTQDEIREALDPNSRKQLVLVRDDRDGRSWAYFCGKGLDSHFRDAYGNEVVSVPKKFAAVAEKLA